MSLEGGDLDWMAIENKVRRLIKELMEPTIRRGMEDREQLSKVNHESELQRRKVDEFEFSFHKIYKKLAIIDDVNKRQTDVEAAQKTLENKTMQQTQTLKTDLEALAADLLRKAETIKSFEKQLEHVNSQVRSFNESLLEFRGAIQKETHEQGIKTQTIIEDMKGNIEKLAEDLNGLDQQQQRVNTALGDTDAGLSANSQLISALRLKTEKLDMEKASVSSVSGLKQEIEKLHLKTIADKNGFERKVKAVTEGLLVQGPYPQQVLIAEWLHEVLDQKSLMRLTELETLKYTSWLDLTTLHTDIRPQIEAALERATALQEELLAAEKQGKPKSRTNEALEETSNSGVSRGSSPFTKSRSRAKKTNQDSEGSFRQGSEESVDLVHDLASRSRSTLRPGGRQSSYSSRTVHSGKDSSEQSPDPSALMLEHRNREELNPTPQFTHIEPSDPASQVSIHAPELTKEESSSSSYHRKSHKRDDSASQISRASVKGVEEAKMLDEKPLTPASSYKSRSKMSSATNEVQRQPPPDDVHLGVTGKSSIYSAQVQDLVAYYTDESNSEEDQFHPALDELRTQLEELGEKVNTDLAVLKDELNEKYAEFLKDVKQNSEACTLLAIQVKSDCAALTTLRKRDKTDLSMDFAELQDQIKALKDDTSAANTVLEHFAQLFTHLVECTRINIALAAQDEEDRQSIALMGYKENRPVSRPGSALKPPVVSLDKQCISCTGQSSLVVSAFKVACLAYAPTPISYRKAVFQRRELLEVQSRVLEAAWDEVSAFEPWTSMKQKDSFEGVPIPRTVRSSQGSSALQKITSNSMATPNISFYPDEVISEVEKDDSPERNRALTAVGDRLPLLPKPGTSSSRRHK